MRGVETLYLRLYEELRAAIVDGGYPYGSRLPSKRTLADRWNCSVVPVEHALALLCEEGYAEAKERSGCFVIYRQDDFPAQTPSPTASPAPKHAPPPPSDLGFSPALLARTMRRVLSECGERIWQRSDNIGTPELRFAIAAYLKRGGGPAVLPEQIVIGAGAEYLYGLVALLLGRERIYALEQPSYEKIAAVYRAHGIACEFLPLAQDGLASLALWNSQAGVLHVTPFHSYPSGITASASKRREYLRWAETRAGFIIEDNYDAELTVSRKNEETLFSVDKNGRVIYLNTFSQTLSPSFRMGYMILPPNLCPLFLEKLGFFSCPVPVFEQYLLASLINSGDFERHINRVRRARRKTGKKDA